METRVIEVRIWANRVGAVAPDPRLGCYVFAYDPLWRKSGIELAPITMPLNDSRTTFAFPNLSEPSYKRLPGLLADALPDDFGNTLIDAWMSRKGVEKRNVTVLDRLSYMGRRGMGALEFKPARGAHRESAEPLEMKSLVEAARMAIQGDLSGDVESQAAIANIIRVGTSAGGARAKAVVTWNQEFCNEFGTWSGAKPLNSLAFIKDEIYFLNSMDENEIQTEIWRRYQLAVKNHTFDGWIFRLLFVLKDGARV